MIDDITVGNEYVKKMIANTVWIRNRKCKLNERIASSKVQMPV